MGILLLLGFFCCCCCCFSCPRVYVSVRQPVDRHRLSGLVVKASSSRATDPGFDYRLRGDFSRPSHTTDFKIGSPVATLPGVRDCRASTGTLWSARCLGDIESLICNFNLSVVCLLVGCLTSHQQASVSQGRICSDSFTCCHTEIEVADQPFYLTQSQYTDTGPTSPSADPMTPGAWQGGHWSAKY